VVHVFLIEVVRSRDHPGSKRFKPGGMLRTDLVSNRCLLSASCPNLLSARYPATSLIPSVRRPLPRQRPLCRRKDPAAPCGNRTLWQQ
jgi:hypothetical protein